MINENITKMNNLKTTPLNRLKHCYGVANFMYQISKTYYHWSEEKAREMYILGMLHDQGYEFDNGLRHEQVIIDILGKDYKYRNEILHHGEYTTEYQSQELDLLWLADMVVDGEGNLVGFEGRLKDLKNRHGNKDNVYLESCKLVEYLSKKF